MIFFPLECCLQLLIIISKELILWIINDNILVFRDDSQSIEHIDSIVDTPLNVFENGFRGLAILTGSEIVKLLQNVVGNLRSGHLLLALTFLLNQPQFPNPEDHCLAKLQQLLPPRRTLLFAVRGIQLVEGDLAEAVLLSGYQVPALGVAGTELLRISSGTWLLQHVALRQVRALMLVTFDFAQMVQL